MVATNFSMACPVHQETIWPAVYCLNYPFTHHDLEMKMNNKQIMNLQSVHQKMKIVGVSPSDTGRITNTSNRKRFSGKNYFILLIAFGISLTRNCDLFTYLLHYFKNYYFSTTQSSY